MTPGEVKILQTAFKKAGFDPGKADGAWGPHTQAAWEAIGADTAGKAWTSTVPLSWLPEAKMTRVIAHWTAGDYEASDFEREHYHILINGDASLVRGIPSIYLNESPLKPGYAPHTLNCNGGAVGVTLCGMDGAQEHPFNSGEYPITLPQWEKLAKVIADVCRRYSIPVDPKRVLSHAEVQSTLGIRQRGKWDISHLPWNSSYDTAAKCGDLLRSMVKENLNG